MRNPPKGKLGTGTRLAHTGRESDLAGPFVNTPVVHASTILFENTEEMTGRAARWVYGRRGTPTSAGLERALAELDGAAGAVLCPSGLNAVATAILAFAGSGDHVLLPDSVYGPGRTLGDTVFQQFGLSVGFYEPTDLNALAAAVTPKTRVIYAESPGSITMEMQDIPGIAAIAKKAGAVLIADNTWATPLYCQPLALGADVALLAATKYIGGHSDLMMGAITANEKHWPKLKRFYGAMGICVGPDDIYLALRGLRTLEIRLERHARSALAVATWLLGRPEVSAVLYPGLPSSPDHALWRRDMSGATGLLSFVLKGTKADASSFLDALGLFGLGYSWGGYESLAILGNAEMHRSVRTAPDAPIIRLHIGLEDPADLIADLEQAFAAIRA
jgi:cystathionine beta-lyase